MSNGVYAEYYPSNPYYSPRSFNLTPVAEIDTGGPYEFDIVIVWRHDDGQLYWAADSGCSCPTPFEDYTTLDMLIPLRSMDDMRGLEEAVARMYAGQEGLHFLNRVRDALREQ